MTRAWTPDVVFASGTSRRSVVLSEFLTGDAADAADAAANAWIKAARHLHVDGVPFRDRFELRGDSLWWFAELYLHKRQVIARALKTIAACRHAIDVHAPETVEVISRDPVIATVVTAVAARRANVTGVSPAHAREVLRSRVKALFHTATALADRLRPHARPAGIRPGGIAAFVHSAFWNQAAHQESYLGPVLDALHADDPGSVRLVGVGPRTNFRGRRWRHRVAEFGDPDARSLPLTPVEAFSPWSTLAPSRRVWSARHVTTRALVGSADLRAHAVVDGIDLWPLVRHELAGIATLQFPWSARAMDEAGAALDALAPAAVLTYAEAGGWGRALVLEARRRGIPSAGMQHGFIYRHWLNYLHEPDEMAPSSGRPSDRGFPCPTRTLIFDGFTAEHLATNGSFPPSALVVVGSPRREQFLDAAQRLDTEARTALRRSLGVPDDSPVVLVAAKHAQLGAWFARTLQAAASAGAVVVVKPHPAETADSYLRDAKGSERVRIADGSMDLPALATVADVLVTAHSTAALEVMAIGVPTLVVGLPTNLSPFVDAGVMCGVDRPESLAPLLSSMLTDEVLRRDVRSRQEEFLDRYGFVQPPGAAGRAAAVIRALAAGGQKRGRE